MKLLLNPMKSLIISFFVSLLKNLQYCRPDSYAEVRILIPAYTGLGNFIMMTPMITSLKNNYPLSQIFIIAGNNFGTEFVLGDSEIIDKTWILHENASIFRKIIFFFKLRREKIDVAFIPFDASPSFYRFGVMIAGIPRRIGHTSEILNLPMGWTRDVLTDAIPVRPNCHETDLHFDLLEALSPGVSRNYGTIVSTLNNEDVLNKFDLKPKTYAIVQISAANGSESPKIWPDNNFHGLIEKLHSSGFIIVLAGDKTEKELVDQFAANCKVPVVNLAGRTTVREIAAIIKEARVLICHDSGLMHIGNAVKTPLVALYGPTDYVYTRPMAETSTVIRKDLPCSPCMKNFAKTENEVYLDCSLHYQCMKMISVDDVLDAVIRQSSVKNKDIKDAY